ncbi:MAG: hypothetical protein JWP92_2786 [Caulobacter sp.]|nr:hypothetical protein [Caulobacter sp.]
MRKRLGLCLVGLAALAVSTVAHTEDWKPTPLDPTIVYDKDFMRVDAQTGLVVLRMTTGKSRGPYKDWPAGKQPIEIYAIDCAADKWMSLGMDFVGDKGLPKNWRKEEQVEDYKGAVGAAGKLACETRETLPKVTLP